MTRVPPLSHWSFAMLDEPEAVEPEPEPRPVEPAWQPPAAHDYGQVEDCPRWPITPAGSWWLNGQRVQVDPETGEVAPAPAPVERRCDTRRIGYGRVFVLNPQKEWRVGTI